MPTLDLKQKYLDSLKTLLHRCLPEAEIWAYGSRVNGTNHDASDLDLVVRNPKGFSLPYLSLNKVRSALSDSNIPILVDIRDWAKIPDYFHQEIEKEHVVIQEPSVVNHKSSLQNTQ